MKEIIVLSGKGGTGKTSIAGSLAALAQKKVLVDCDVDASNLHLLLKPVSRGKYAFLSGKTAVIDPEKCTQCRLCQQLCRFNAISDFTIDSIACEGCGFCARICPAQAIAMNENLAGHWFISDTEYGTLVHAQLGVAQENSGKLIATIRKQARAIAEQHKADFIISDGPPGIGCPVISSLSGVDLALLVTEPTLSGMHDLERIVGVCRHFEVPAAVCINKFDINMDNTRQIEQYCQREQIEVIARIPFDIIVNEAIAKGVPVVTFSRGEVSQQIRILWQNAVRILTILSGGKQHAAL